MFVGEALLTAHFFFRFEFPDLLPDFRSKSEVFKVPHQK